METSEYVLPDWVQEIRPHQSDAIEQIREEFARGKEVVVLDAPTGSGKTLIGDVVRQELGGRGLYVCSDKGLQDQFLVDFPDSRVLKGRSNYLPQKRIRLAGEMVTCDDCTGRNCPYCLDVVECPYIVARGQAMRADTAVLNSAYFLAEANGPGKFAGRELVVIDEADTLEPALMRWVEVRVGGGRVRSMGLRVPGKGTHQRTIVKWVRGQLIPALGAEYTFETDPKKKRTIQRQVGQLNKFVQSWSQGDVWIRDNVGDDYLIMKPVEVAPFGKDAVWRHGRKFLLMSASVISAQMMLDGLGWKREFGYVQVPMTFPLESRRVIVAPVADMSKKGKERGEWDKMTQAIKGVLKRHPGDRVLVHAVSYELTKKLASELSGCGRDVFHYMNAQERQRAIDDYAATEGAVLVAPSLERGVDFAGDLCRVVVVAKVPFPYLGDPQVSARLNSTDTGQVWYGVETIRAMVQMTGRGVRSASDHATSYILDSSFMSVMRRNQHLFPKWWDEALNTNFPSLSLME